ncbi:hypothetical protein GCM10011344_47040 [Dokdonia pacifica]|uniref:Uncharacterized protein n=1 Tax=Dokdonia pacifica TaxID=1627892 RepID=A0A239DPV1_9FLAO|nr:hypothetical protein [Dokdonia pacifica]GGG40797.1 hypothetical protein GCM10011344_47040 [Dokdonia pacifica]SNS34530.1 hypothetical protein SAMN06265376_1126 [Dokdonia pacifica]
MGFLTGYKIITILLKIYRSIKDKEYFTKAVFFLIIGIPFSVNFYFFPDTAENIKIYDAFTDSLSKDITSIIGMILFFLLFKIILPIFYACILIGSLGGLLLSPYNFILGIIDLDFD